MVRSSIFVMMMLFSMTNSTAEGFSTICLQAKKKLYALLDNSYCAAQAYQGQDYKTAQNELVRIQVEAPKDPTIEYNLGLTYYQQGDYEAAIARFNHGRNLTLDHEEKLMHSLLFNLGTTYLKYALHRLPDDWQTKQIEESVLDALITLLTKALDIFDDLLLRAPEHEGAKTNRQIAQELLQALLEKRMQQKQQQEEKKDDKPEQEESDHNKQNDQKQDQNQQQNEQGDQQSDSGNNKQDGSNDQKQGSDQEQQQQGSDQSKEKNQRGQDGNQQSDQESGNEPGQQEKNDQAGDQEKNGQQQESGTEEQSGSDGQKKQDALKDNQDHAGEQDKKTGEDSASPESGDAQSSRKQDWSSVKKEDAARDTDGADKKEQEQSQENTGSSESVDTSEDVVDENYQSAAGNQDKNDNEQKALRAMSGNQKSENAPDPEMRRINMILDTLAARENELQKEFIRYRTSNNQMRAREHNW